MVNKCSICTACACCGRWSPVAPSCGRPGARVHPQRDLAAAGGAGAGGGSPAAGTGRTQRPGDRRGRGAGAARRVAAGRGRGGRGRAGRGRRRSGRRGWCGSGPSNPPSGHRRAGGPVPHRQPSRHPRDRDEIEVEEAAPALRLQQLDAVVVTSTTASRAPCTPTCTGNRCCANRSGWCCRPIIPRRPPVRSGSPSWPGCRGRRRSPAPATGRCTFARAASSAASSRTCGTAPTTSSASSNWSGRPVPRH